VATTERAVPCLIEYGQRCRRSQPQTGATKSAAARRHSDATLLLGRRIFSSYGKSPNDIVMILQDAEQVNKSWREWHAGSSGCGS